MGCAWSANPTSDLGLDLYKDAGGHNEAVESLDGAVIWFNDVDDALVSADLELLAALLVDERRTKNGVDLSARWQRHRAGNVLSSDWNDDEAGLRTDTPMQGGKIRIRMEAYDHQALDASAREIVDHAKRTGAHVAGPVPLPTRREIYTVLRSPFVDKKSREQFEIRTHKRIIDIIEPNHRTVEALNRLVVPAGVFVKIKA